MIIVFDIGGTRIRAARSAGPGLVEPFGEWPTPGDFEAFAGVLAGAARGARAVVLSIAGVVDPVTGRSVAANIPAIHGRTIAADLTAVLGRPVLVANDADCFALAEALAGAGRGHQVVFGLILGTGAGGGLVVDGRVHRGAGGYAGEWGHGPVLRTEALGERVPHWRCGCGQSGCVDTLAGARGLERLHGHLAGQELTSEAIVMGWGAGQSASVRTIAVWLDLVSAPLAMVVNVIGPSVVPVGGGLSKAESLVAALDRAVRARILRSSAEPLLVPAVNRMEPGLIGASFLGYREAGLG